MDNFEDIIAGYIMKSYGYNKRGTEDEETDDSLFSAIYNGHSEVVEYLVEQGIDLTASYKFGKSGQAALYRPV